MAKVSRLGAVLIIVGSTFGLIALGLLAAEAAGDRDWAFLRFELWVLASMALMAGAGAMWMVGGLSLLAALGGLSAGLSGMLQAYGSISALQLEGFAAWMPSGLLLLGVVLIGIEVRKQQKESRLRSSGPAPADSA